MWATWFDRLVRVPRRWREAGGALIVYLAFYFLIDANAVRYPYLVTPLGNSNVAEARAIASGRLDLPDRTHDTAWFRDKVYNVYPPMFTLVSLGVLPWMPDGVPSVLLIVLLALPLPGLAYALFLRRAGPVWLATVLTLCYLFGTSLLPVMNRALERGEVWYVNHVLSQIGVLIFLLDYFGRRRIWPGAAGLVVACWSRQLMGVYLLPLLFSAWAGGDRSQRLRRVAAGLVCAALIAAVPMTLNTLKFGHPLDSGYRNVYEGRGDEYAAEAKQGLFSPRFVPRNLYAMNLGFPEVEAIGGVIRFRPNLDGTGIWWTTPLLLYVLVDVRRLWSDRAARMLLLSVVMVFAALALYHTTGRQQGGFNRFSLDYVPVMLAVLAPYADGLRRRLFTPVLTVWSVWYFRWAI